MPRPLARHVTALLAAGLLAGCAASSPDGAAPPGPAPAGPLQVVGPFEVHSLDPATAGGMFTRLEVAETLVGADDDGTLEPMLASAWDAAPDGRSWRFELREGARFHDDTPVTGETVAAALDAVRDAPESPLSEAPIAAIEAEDAAITVTLDAPYAPLPAALAHTSAQILAPSAYGDDGQVERVVGSGPYAAERVRLPDTIELVAADTYDGPPPAIEAVTFRSVSRSETRTAMAESGQSHVAFGMDPISLARLSADARVEVESVTVPRTIQLKVNAGHPLLEEPEVRRAISLALDRDGMASALLRDPEMAATQLFPPTLDVWHQDDLEPLRHDPDEARALLEEAGFTPGPDGTLTRDGEPFAVTLRTFTDRPELPPVATAIQSELAAVGIDLEVAIGNSSEIPAAHQDGSLELALYARGYALTPDPLAMLLGDFAPDGHDWGAMNWSSDDLTARLGALAAGDAADADDPAAAADRARVAAILHEELPVIPVAWYRQSAVLDPRLAGFTLDPLELSFRLSDLSWGEA